MAGLVLLAIVPLPGPTKLEAPCIWPRPSCLIWKFTTQDLSAKGITIPIQRSTNLLKTVTHLRRVIVATFHGARGVKNTFKLLVTALFSVYSGTQSTAWAWQ